MNKSQIREIVRERRLSIPTDQRLNDERTLTAFLQASIKNKVNANIRIGLYYSVKGEISPMGLLQKFTEVQFALPVIRNKVTLEFYDWDGEHASLAKRDFDIPIPDTRGQSPVVPDIIIVPITACDDAGNRIGQGAGHYDRYIASLDQKPFLIGVCFEEQIIESVPAEQHDIRMDLIVTPKRVIEIA